MQYQNHKTSKGILAGPEKELISHVSVISCSPNDHRLISSSPTKKIVWAHNY